MRDLTLQELANITQKHVETLRRFARTGRLHGAYRFGRTWMVRAEAVDEIRGITAKVVRP